jgi:signal transduction histidine kinase
MLVEETPSGTMRQDPHAWGARTHTVWLGFLLLLALILLAGVYSLVSISRLEQNSAKVRAEAHNRDELLDQLANGVYRLSAVSGDYLLEPDDDRVFDRIAEVKKVRAQIYETLASYERTLNAEEDLAEAAALRRNLDAYWATVEPPLRWTLGERERETGSYIRERLLPKRGDVVELVRQITAQDEREIENAEQNLQAAYHAFERGMIVAFALTFVVGAVAAILSIRRNRRLEEEAEIRYEQVEEAGRQLRDLSDRLVNAQEDERRRLSRELHDQLGQTMSAMVTELRRLESMDGPFRDRLARIRQSAEDNVRSIRDTALLLRPSMLDDLGLIPALRWQAREVRRHWGLKVRIAAEEIGDELPDAHKTCVYRVVQEALNNTVKHAKATEARVILRWSADGLLVVVQDDGIGFDSSKDRGMGLIGMEERVRRLRGRFRIDSQAGSGTVLSFLFPGLKPAKNLEVEHDSNCARG